MPAGYAHKEPIKPAPWHGLVAWDLLLNGLTTGLFLVAALGELASPATFAPLARAAYPLALVFLLADLALLVLDLGDVRRFHYMLRVFKPTSPMSLGVWSLTAYSLPLSVAALLSLLPGGGIVEGVRKGAVFVGIVPALASAVYKGVLLSTSAQPGWREARWLGGYLTSAAVVLGCAQMIVLAYLTGQPSVAQVLRPALGLLLVVHAVPALLLGVELRRGQRGLDMRLAGVATVLLPLSLLLVGEQPVWMVTAALLIILGNLAARFVLVQLPHRAT